jgi:hypothetical protein
VASIARQRRLYGTLFQIEAQLVRFAVNRQEMSHDTEYGKTDASLEE